MSTQRRRARRDPYVAQSARAVIARAGGGLVFFLACVVLSSAFEIARFPERRSWMLGFAGGFFVLAGLCWTIVRLYPRYGLTASRPV